MHFSSSWLTEKRRAELDRSNGERFVNVSARPISSAPFSFFFVPSTTRYIDLFSEPIESNEFAEKMQDRSFSLVASRLK